jgi:hypothetical protein
VNVTEKTVFDAEEAGLAKLREPFAANEINVLPKPHSKDSPKGRCSECGGFHGLPAVHLDYVGHAALTKRLLEADPYWTWEPVAFDTKGLPQFDDKGGLWIRLTVCGVTRLGYGDAQGKTGGNAIKEAIGDALRNSGMRFGAALDLWHKGDLFAAQEERGDETTADRRSEPAEKPAADTVDQIALAVAQIELIEAASTLEELEGLYKASAGFWDVKVGRKTVKTVTFVRKAELEKGGKE